MVTLIVILVFLLIIGANWWFGSWNILLNLINFYLAALVATNYYEVAADRIESFNSTFTYLADFVALWGIFFITFVILRAVTELMSKYKLSLPTWLEYSARSLLVLWLAGGFFCFTMFSLHMAPLPPDAYQVTVSDKVYGFGPDRMWLAFVQSRSRGALAESKNAMFVPEYDLAEHPDDEGADLRVFDPMAQFIPTYHKRRDGLSRITALRVNK